MKKITEKELLESEDLTSYKIVTTTLHSTSYCYCLSVTAACLPCCLFQTAFHHFHHFHHFIIFSWKLCLTFVFAEFVLQTSQKLKSLQSFSHSEQLWAETSQCLWAGQYQTNWVLSANSRMALANIWFYVKAFFFFYDSSEIIYCRSG